MIHRRRLLANGAGLVCGLLNSETALAANQISYEDAVRSTWKPLQADGGVHELLRYATLAANSHNTQPWTFKIEPSRVIILADPLRRCPAVDPDDHHLFVSLGCATENLVQAAAAMGLRADHVLEAGKITISLENSRAERSALFEAIPFRQSTRAAYDGRSASNDALRLLEQAGSGPGMELILVTERSRIEQIAEHVVAGNTAQMSDPAFMEELIAWMRFNEGEAIASRDGLFTRASGAPTMPRWLARPLLRWVFTAESENKKYNTHVRSSAGVAIFVSESNDQNHWFNVGRACQRFALQTTALGMKCAFINQPVEVPALREQFTTYLGVQGRRPDLVMRFGYGPELPKSLRRPVQLGPD
jgi:hypothetical protein